LQAVQDAEKFSVHFVNHGKAHCISLYIQCFSSNWSEI